MVGQTISHYQILDKIGEGGMGIVYKAEDLQLGRTVALKFLAPHAAEDTESKTRFLREARTAASLDHPNICTVYEIGEAGGQPFFSMAFIEGQTVRDKIRERPLPLDEALDIGIQAGEGLAVAHKKGVIHRDVKSANLMVTPEGSGEGDGLWPGTGGQREQAHQDRRHTGNRVLYVTRAGAAARTGPPQRHLVAGRGALRDGDGPAALRGGGGATDPFFHHHRGPRTGDGVACWNTR